jgi:hypothetical protein
MASEMIDYNAVLADLEAKKTAIDAAISGVRQMLNLGAEQGIGGPVPSGERRDQPSSVRFDSFFQMSLPAAITKFLEMSKCPQTVSDMTKALLDGGFKTTSKNLMPIVGSNLSRMKSNGEVVNIDGKWGLSAWYPAARTAPAKSKGKKRGRPKSGKTKAAQTDAPKTEPKASASKPTAEQIERMKTLQATGKKPGEIGKQLGISTLTVWRTLKPNSPKAATA